ncbi:MAG: GNAT family N-acetyltransferase [Burkholderiales bacterium]|nr:GNAT family N-acetyltransferase [Burkholderiales bacterium]
MDILNISSAEKKVSNHIYETDRLILRRWKDEDLNDLYLLGNDDEVMKYLDKSSPYTIDRTINLINSYQNHFVRCGFGPMACIEKKSNNLIGAIAFRYFKGVPHLANKVELGWRISSNYWGNGYAGEIAQKIFEISFLELHFEEIIAIVSEQNSKSIRALDKLGMLTNPKNNFIHLERKKELNPYRLYTLTREQYLERIG